MVQTFDIQTDIDEALKKYPLLGLEVNPKEKLIRLVGEIEVIDPVSNQYLDLFDVEIYYRKEFPKRFPVVFETGKKIPRKTSRHVIPDPGNLCLAVPLEEKLLCKHGISTVWFLDKVLVPRLAEEYCVNHGGSYQREYSHDSGGIWEYLIKELNTEDQDIILTFTGAMANQKLPKGDRPCPCGSGNDYGKCHRKTIIQLQQLGKDDLINLHTALSKQPYEGVNLA